MSCRRQGFTILEMSIVLVIIAVVLAGGAVTFAVSLQQRQYDETYAKLEVIQKALLDYRRTFRRLPCPADIDTYDTSERYFGKEAGTVATCSGTPTSTYSASTPGGDYIYGGMVPTKTLQLPDEYAFDGWGRRFLYAVESNFVQTDAFLTESDITYDAANDVGRITVRNGQSEDITVSAVYVLLSFGVNGHGAYPRFVNSGVYQWGGGGAANIPADGGGTMYAGGTYQLASNQSGHYSWPGREVATDWANTPGVPSNVIILAGLDVGGGGDTGDTVEISPVQTPRITGGSSNTSELENCDCDVAGEDGTFDYVFVQAPIVKNADDPSDDFDDIVAFKTRGDLTSMGE